MKTQPSSAVKLAGAILGIGVLIVYADGVDQGGQKTNAAPAVSVGSTNTAVPTNAPASDSEPLAKIAPTIPTSPGLAEIVKLAQAGVEQDVLLAYVQNSQVAYNPTADELVYLHDVGIPPKVVTAIIERGNSLREEAAKASLAAAGVQPPQPASAGAPSPAPADNTAPIATTPAVAATPPPAYPGYPVESPSYSVPAPPVAAAEVAMPAQVDYFYNSLAPYGTWYDMPDYGWCWQPSVVVVQPAWRPYCDYGRWLNSDSGWYWHSDYSWGWAPFHYGRWFRHDRCGWLWVPDTVWGPSWVSWRQSPLYYGWAPLPPAAVYGVGGGFSYFGASVGVGFGFGLGFADFTFLPVGHFCDWNPRRFFLTGGLARNAFNQTIIVNNYIQGPNNRIINVGVDRGLVTSVTRSEIPKVAIRDLTPAAGKVVKPGQLERSGSTLVVYRPQPLSRSPARPASRLTARRQELPAQVSANSNPASHSAAVATPNRVAASPQGLTRSSAAYATTPRSLAPTPSAGPRARPETIARNEFGVGIERGLTAPGNRSQAALPSARLLGRYPTQAPAMQPAGATYPTTADAASLPRPWIGSETRTLTRQESLKPAGGEMRLPSRSALPSEAKAMPVRPSFYNPPPFTSQPAPARSALPSYDGPRSARSDGAVNYSRPAMVPEPAQPLPNRSAPAYSPRPNFERPAYTPPSAYAPPPSYAPRPVYSQPRSAPSVPSYQPVRSQPANGGSVSRSPSYSAPSSSGRRNNGS